MSDRYDVVVIGSGLIGLASAYQLLLARPGLSVVVVDKEAEPATHQSGHNSGVIHSPNTYLPGSRKAALCHAGRLALLRFADEHGIAYELCGELIVATDESELPRLATIRERATANGVEGIRELGPDEMREVEPYVAGVRALHVPTTGIIDFRQVGRAYADEVAARGGEIRLSTEVRSIDVRESERVVVTTKGELHAAHVIACAGLHSDRIAATTGDAGEQRIVPFRGDYYTLRPEARRYCRTLIYPVPDPRFPFLGVHFTRRIDGEVWAGPNAVLAFAREGYRRRDISPRDLGETLLFPGFRGLARRYLREGLAELWRDWWKPAFVSALQRYVPDVRGSDLTFGPSGVRAQAVEADGSLVDDFSFGVSRHVLHVRNAPSPGATASLAIGRSIAEMAIERFGIERPAGRDAA